MNYHMLKLGSEYTFLKTVTINFKAFVFASWNYLFEKFYFLLNFSND